MFKEILIGYVAQKGLDKIFSLKDIERVYKVYLKLSDKYGVSQSGKFHFCDSKVFQDAIPYFFFDDNFSLDKLVSDLRANENILPFETSDVESFLNELLELCSKVPELVKYEILRQSKSHGSSLNEILKLVKELADKAFSPNTTNEFLEAQLSRLENQIHNLKLETAQDTLNDIDSYFENKVDGYDKSIHAKIKYFQGLCCCHFTIDRSKELFIEAFKLIEKGETYDINITIEYAKQMVLSGDLEEANRVISEYSLEEKRPLDPVLAFIKCVSSGDFITAVTEQSELIQSNKKFIRECYSYCARSKEFTCQNLPWLNWDFGKLPKTIEYDNLYIWIHIAEYTAQQLLEHQNAVPYVRDSNFVETKLLTLVELWSHINLKDEIRKSLLGIGVCVHYFSYLLYSKEEDYDAFLKLFADFEIVDKQKVLYFLLKANLFFLKGYKKEAYELLNELPPSEGIAGHQLLYAQQMPQEFYEKALVNFIDNIQEPSENTMAILLAHLNDEKLKGVCEQLSTIDFATEANNDFWQQYLLFYLGEEISYDTLIKIKDVTYKSTRIKIAHMLASIGYLTDASEVVDANISWDAPDNSDFLDALHISKEYKILRTECYKMMQLQLGIIDFPVYIYAWFLELALRINDYNTAWDILIVLKEQQRLNEDLYSRYIELTYWKKNFIILRNNIEEIFSRTFTNQKNIISICNTLIASKLYKEAVDFCYTYAVETSNLEVRKHFVEITNSPLLDSLITAPKVIGESVYVHYLVSDNKAKTQLMQVVKGAIGEKLIGLENGNSIVLDFPFEGEKAIEIVGLESKYSVLASQIFSEFGSNSLGYEVKSFECNEDMSITFDELKKFIVEAKKTDTDDVSNEKYNDGTGSLYDVFDSKWIKQTFRASFYNAPLRQNSRILEERVLDDNNAHGVNDLKFVPDLTALWLLSSLGNIEYKNNMPLVVSANLVTRLKTELLTISVHPPEESYLNVIDDELQIVHSHENFTKDYIEQLTKLIQWIETNCEITLMYEMLQVDRGALYEEVYSFVEWLMLATRKHHLIITDDWGFKTRIKDPILRNLHTITVETFVNYFTNYQGDISSVLFEKNRIGCSIQHDVFTRVIKNCSIDSLEFTRVCETLKINPLLAKEAVETMFCLEAADEAKDYSPFYKKMISALTKDLDEALNCLEVIVRLRIAPTNAKQNIINSINGVRTDT